MALMVQNVMEHDQNRVLATSALIREISSDTDIMSIFDDITYIKVVLLYSRT